MKIIDAHTHVFPQYAEMAVAVMDAVGIECCVTAEWHDGFGETLKRHLEIFNRFPGRFIVFGNVDFSKINEPDFAVKAAERMERDVEAGMRGLKIYKALGLEYKDEQGNFWRVNDERLDPIWAKAGELNIPVLMHTADPIAFWQPVNEYHFWNAVLRGEYAWWDYYRKGFPAWAELIGERNDVIRRHPDTTFICPHVGSNSHNLQAAADDLDALPNLYYDISARIPMLGLPGRRAKAAREFFIEYQDRILFGTDVIYDDVNVPTGIQAQMLYQPGQIPLQPGEIPEEKYVETTIAFIRSHLDFLATDAMQEKPPFNRNIQGFSIQGLALPQPVLEKVYWKNAQRILQR